MKHYSLTRKPALSTHKNDHIFIRTIPPLFKACSLLCLIFLLLCKHEVIAEESSILWAADFSKSPATEFGEELEILEDGNQHLLRASTKQFLFHKQTRTPESLQWENYLVKTRFRQPEVIDFLFSSFF